MGRCQLLLPAASLLAATKEFADAAQHTVKALEWLAKSGFLRRGAAHSSLHLDVLLRCLQWGCVAVAATARAVAAAAAGGAARMCQCADTRAFRRCVQVAARR